MKIIAFFAILLLATQAAFAIDPPRFPTDKEAVDYYLQLVQKVKPTTSQQFIALAVNDQNDKDAIAKYRPMLAMLDIAMETAGAFRSAEVMKVLKYGSQLRHAGYLVMYEHNFIIFDMWFVNSTKGWQMTKFNFNVNSDPSETIAKIPPEFGSPMEGY